MTYNVSFRCTTYNDSIFLEITYHTNLWSNINYIPVPHITYLWLFSTFLKSMDCFKEFLSHPCAGKHAIFSVSFQFSICATKASTDLFITASLYLLTPSIYLPSLIVLPCGSHSLFSVSVSSFRFLVFVGLFWFLDVTYKWKHKVVCLKNSLF